jgi:hypothetical protein
VHKAQRRAVLIGKERSTLDRHGRATRKVGEGKDPSNAADGGSRFVAGRHSS